jgi:hypothetical protein
MEFITVITDNTRDPARNTRGPARNTRGPARLPDA